MLRFERSQARRELTTPDGKPYTLVAENLAVSLQLGPVGAAAMYQRPRAIERAGASYPLVDTVMVVRLAALLAVILAALVGVWRR